MKDVATATVERADNVAGLSIACGIASIVDMSYCTKQKILRKSMQFYPCKIKYVQELCHIDHDKQMTFDFTVLIRIEVVTLDGIKSYRNAGTILTSTDV